VRQQVAEPLAAELLLRRRRKVARPFAGPTLAEEVGTFVVALRDETLLCRLKSLGGDRVLNLSRGTFDP
jgi:hypothetical protein